MKITQEEINERVNNYRGRHENGLRITEKRIQEQMEHARAIIAEQESVILKAEKELTIHYIALEIAGNIQ